MNYPLPQDRGNPTDESVPDAAPTPAEPTPERVSMEAALRRIGQVADDLRVVSLSYAPSILRWIEQAMTGDSGRIDSLNAELAAVERDITAEKGSDKA